jgi:hypothetical protein
MKYKNIILVISFSDLKRDPRVYRQLFFLHNVADLKIHSAGFDDPQIEGVDFIELKHKYSQIDRAFNVFRLKMHRFEEYYWSSFLVKDAFEKLKDIPADIIVANDLNTLPLAISLAENHGSKLYLDAHEYTPRQFEDKWTFRFFFQRYWDYVAKNYMPKADVVTTVCQGISREYERVYGVASEVFTNAPFFNDLEPRKSTPNRINMIHHGSATSSRQLENMIFLMGFLDDRFYLDFMLVPSQAKYFSKLKELSQGNPRINFRDPVPMLDIPEVINQYDIGLYLLSPSTFNCEMALPNKIFEFIQGRVAVATWPSREMKTIVEQYSCGVVSQEFTLESIAESLNQLTSDQIQTFKENANIAASELCAERNFERMSQILSSLLA